MGCISSKKARCESPDYRRRQHAPTTQSRRRRNGRRRSSSSSSLLHSTVSSFGPLEGIKEEPEKEEGLEDYEEEEVIVNERKNGSSRALKGPPSHPKPAFSLKFGRPAEGEHAAASAWPSWFSAVAGEAIEGWSPLRSDSFKRLEKVSCCWLRKF